MNHFECNHFVFLKSKRCSTVRINDFFWFHSNKFMIDSNKATNWHCKAEYMLIKHKLSYFLMKTFNLQNKTYNHFDRKERQEWSCSSSPWHLPFIIFIIKCVFNRIPLTLNTKHWYLVFTLIKFSWETIEKWLLLLVQHSIPLVVEVEKVKKIWALFPSNTRVAIYLDTPN